MSEERNDVASAARLEGPDAQSLSCWMREHISDFHGPLEITRFNGGQSNPTYHLRTPQRSYVLRRKPPGPLLKGAHAVDREARVMTALEQAGIPVPHVYGLCTDDSVIGSWFLVMDMVQGRIFWDARFLDVPKAARAAYFDAMNATLAALHSVDPAAVGLGDYGRAGAYIHRQLERWSRQYLDDRAAGRNDCMDKVIDWLSDNVPSGDETTIIHGDYRADNMIFHPSLPRVSAVLDWELSTLGHPLADFGYHAMMYRMPSDILGGVAGLDFAAWGIPAEDAYVADYCSRTGRDSIPDLDYYIAFNMFRFAAILHGIRGRVIRGTAAGSDAGAMAARFERVAQLAWDQSLGRGTCGRT